MQILKHGEDDHFTNDKHLYAESIVWLLAVTFFVPILNALPTNVLFKFDALHMENKLLSIITVTYNAANTLERAIRSVKKQNHNLFNYYIIDGCSSDETVSIIKRYEDFLAGWISEKDSGIYEAMNKGISNSTGRWIYFLGADDVLAEGIIEKIYPYLSEKASLIYGNVEFDNEHLMVSSFSNRILLQNTIHHQSAFYNAENFNSFRYDTDLKAISDYELNLKIFLQKKETVYLPLTIAYCNTGGVSAELNTSLKETNTIRAKYIHGKTINMLLSFILKLYYIKKEIRFKIYGHLV